MSGAASLLLIACVCVWVHGSMVKVDTPICQILTNL